jgi:hypothetical protein
MDPVAIPTPAIDKINCQSTSAVLMIRPCAFDSNRQTAASNSFQQPSSGTSAAIARQARVEVDALAGRLKEYGVQVHSFDGRPEGDAPDECFANNWISTHSDGTVVLYPMLAANRRRERRPELLAQLSDTHSYRVRRIVDLSTLEDREFYLEGTGSAVIDHVNRVAYACISPRTSPVALDAFAEKLGYEVVSFSATTQSGAPIYHTNVMLSIGQRFAVICSAAVADPKQRSAIIKRLQSSGREVINISPAQMHAFAANCLELRGSEPIIVLSERALQALDPEQQDRLRFYGRPVSADLSTIETHGGGSARCLLAEIFLPND